MLAEPHGDDDEMRKQLLLRYLTKGISWAGAASWNRALRHQLRDRPKARFGLTLA